MITIDSLTQFFGWCTVINIGIYLWTVIGVTFFRGAMTKISKRIFAVNEDVILRETFAYVANYKLAITVLCLVPYIALKIMA